MRVCSSATVDGGGVAGGTDVSLSFLSPGGLRGLTDAVFAFSNWKPRLSRVEITLDLLRRGTRI